MSFHEGILNIRTLIPSCCSILQGNRGFLISMKAWRELQKISKFLFVSFIGFAMSLMICLKLTSLRPARSLRKSAFSVAFSVVTLPKIVVRPMTSISGELKAQAKAIESSTPGSVSIISFLPLPIVKAAMPFHQGLSSYSVRLRMDHWGKFSYSRRNCSWNWEWGQSK